MVFRKSENEVAVYSRELTTFIAAAEQGSFLKASRTLYTTPASVMNQINKLESEVGVALLERTNQGVRLTPAGRSIYTDAKNIIRLSEQAMARARRIAGDARQTVRVGTSILRPCRTLVDLWSEIDDGEIAFSVQIVPFDDSPNSMELMLDSLGRDIDCFVGPCDSLTWKQRYNMLLLEPVNCCIAVPKNHRLAEKCALTWNDLSGETLILVRRGESLVLNGMRDDIERNHPDIALIDAPHFYDVGIFNECEQRGCLMETLDIWKGVPPAMKTLPVAWNYHMPYGIVYAKRPSDAMRQFIEKIQKHLSSRKAE